MRVVNQEEIIKIAAHLFCRIHHGIYIKFFPFRIRREYLRQHANLNGCCQTQLRLNPFFFRRSFRQVVFVNSNFLLHISHNLAQFFQLIACLNVQPAEEILFNTGIRPAYGILFRRAGNFADRFYQTALHHHADDQNDNDNDNRQNRCI